MLFIFIKKFYLFVYHVRTTLTVRRILAFSFASATFVDQFVTLNTCLLHGCFCQTLQGQWGHILSSLSSLAPADMRP